MKFKCPCGSGHYQIFRTMETWNETFVSNDNFPDPDSGIMFDAEERTEKWTVQCEFCNKMWGNVSSFKRMTGILKRAGVLT